MTQEMYDVAVIGEGVSGLTAANRLATGGLKVATFEAQLFGGLVINVNELDPGPDERQVSGAEFAAELMQANAELGVTSIQEAVTEIGNGGALPGGDRGRDVRRAPGHRRVRRAAEEARRPGRGRIRGARRVAVRRLRRADVSERGSRGGRAEATPRCRKRWCSPNFCSKVHVVHRGGSFRARKHLVEQVGANPKIATIWNATVEQIAGSRMVEKVCVKLGDGRVQDIPCAGVFAYIGLAPNSEFLPPQVKRDETGLVAVTESLETTMAGVWAIGAVRQGYSGLLRDAMAEARRVAESISGRRQ